MEKSKKSGSFSITFTNIYLTYTGLRIHDSCLLRSHSCAHTKDYRTYSTRQNKNIRYGTEYKKKEQDKTKRKDNNKEDGDKDKNSKIGQPYAILYGKEHPDVSREKATAFSGHKESDGGHCTTYVNYCGIRLQIPASLAQIEHKKVHDIPCPPTFLSIYTKYNLTTELKEYIIAKLLLATWMCDLYTDKVAIVVLVVVNRNDDFDVRCRR